MSAPTTTTLTLTAQSTAADLASLLDEQVRIVTPHGERVLTGVVSYALHRERGGVYIRWVGQEYPSYVPYGSTVEIEETR